MNGDPLAPPEHNRSPTNNDLADVYRLVNDCDNEPRVGLENGIAETTMARDDAPKAPSCFDSAGAVANLCSATLGAGVLSLPYALYQSGLVVGGLLLCFSGLATYLSIRILAQACQHYHVYTYETLLTAVDSPRLRDLVQIAIVVFCLGCAIAYVIAIGDILQQAHLLIGNSRWMSMTVVWASIMVPLSLLRRMQSMQWASATGLASIATLIFASALHLMDDLAAADVDPPQNVTSYALAGDNPMPSLGDFLWPANGWLSILTATPIVLFAFSCQVNVPAIYQELSSQGDKLARMHSVTARAVGVCAILYTAISLVAVADFGAGIAPNVLSNYELKGTMQVASGAMAAAVIMAFPLNIFPARTSVSALLFPHRGSSTADPTLTEALLEEEGQPTPPSPPPGPKVPEDYEIANEMTRLHNPSRTVRFSDDEGSVAMSIATTTTVLETDLPLPRHICLTMLLTGLALGLAIVVPDISVVFGLLGGTTTSILGFVVPGAIGRRLAAEQEARALWWSSTALLVGGVLIGVLTTSVTVYDTFA